MHSVLRSYVTAGVALAGASVIAVTPIAAIPPDVQVANPAVRLAADSIANVPVNLFYAVVNIPANEVTALNHWADALEAGGSWWLKTPTNVWGWDPGNPPMLEALVAVLVPFPVISGNGGLPAGITPNGEGPAGAGPSKVITAGNSILGGSAQPGTLGYMLNVIAAAELPMHEGCGFTCDDVLTALGGYFQVPLSEVFGGYTFDEVDDANQPGYPVAWSGQTIDPIDPLEPFTNFWNSLTADPSDPHSQAAAGIKIVSLQDLISTGTRLSDSGTVAFSPWFEGSYLFTGFPLYDSDILFGGLIKGIIDRTLMPAPVTSIPAPSAPTVTLDAAPAPGGIAQQKVRSGDAISSAKRAFNTSMSTPIVPAAPLAPQTEATPEVPPAPAATNVALPTTATQQVTSTTNSGVVTVGGNKFEPGQVTSGGGAASGGRLAGAVKTVTNRVTSTLTKVTDRLKGTDTGDSSSDTGD